MYHKNWQYGKVNICVMLETQMCYIYICSSFIDPRCCCTAARNRSVELCYFLLISWSVELSTDRIPTWQTDPLTGGFAWGDIIQGWERWRWWSVRPPLGGNQVPGVSCPGGLFVFFCFFTKNATLKSTMAHLQVFPLNSVEHINIFVIKSCQLQLLLFVFFHEWLWYFSVWWLVNMFHLLLRPNRRFWFHFKWIRQTNL